MKTNKVLVSTDIGSDIDDALSVLAMFNSGINVQAIYTTNAKDLRFRDYIAKHMVDLAEKQIIVGQGESRSLEELIEPYWYFEDCYADDRFIDEESYSRTAIEFLEPEKVGIELNGVENMAEKLRKEKHTVFSLAPLTNIAKLIQDYLDSIRNIEHLYIMGASINGRIEHNIRYDAIAAEIVLDSQIPITIIPGDLCERYRMSAYELEALKDSTGASPYVYKMVRGFVAAKTAQTIQESKLLELLENNIFPYNSSKIDLEDREKLLKMSPQSRQKLIVNLDDPYYGAFEPEQYFAQYEQLIEHLKDPEINYKKGELAIKLLNQAIHSELSVADVYVPYCFLHPERLTITKGNLEGGKAMGETRIVEGNRYDIVTDLDFEHFKEFTRQYLK